MYGNSYDPLERRVAWLEQNNADLQQQLMNVQRKLEQAGSSHQINLGQNLQGDSDWVQQWINNLDSRISKLEQASGYPQNNSHVDLNWLSQNIDHRIQQWITNLSSRISQLEQANSSQQTKLASLDNINNLYSALNSFQDRISKLENSNRSSSNNTNKLESTVASLQNRVAELERENQSLQDTVKKLSQVKEKFHNRLKQLEETGESQRDTIPTQIVTPAQEKVLVDVAAEYKKHEDNSVGRRREETLPPQRVRSTDNPRVNQNSQIISQFNNLIRLSGVDFKRAREKFSKNFDVKAFKCGNVEIRMNNPNIKPNFVDDSINGNGNYWAVPTNGVSFDVFPNLKVYNDNLHNERAMGIVFDSNFQAGRVYEKVRVEVPAKFRRNGNEWILESTGKLFLE